MSVCVLSWILCRKTSRLVVVFMHGGCPCIKLETLQVCSKLQGALHHDIWYMSSRNCGDCR